MFGRRDARAPGADAARDEVVRAAAGIEDPATGRPVSDAGRLKSVTVTDGAVSVGFEWDTPVFDAHREIERTLVARLRALSWVKSATVTSASAVSATPRPSGTGILPGVRNVVAVASGKGGVGKSTIAVNLAAALGRAGARTGLLDADIYGPSIPIMLGTREKITVVERDGKKLLVPVRAGGLALVSMGFLVDEEKPMIWRGPMVHGAVQQFLRDVDWGDLDYLVIDLPPGTGDVQLTMVQSVPLTGAVIVTTPQDVAMIDARKAFNMFRETRVEILGIVENMSTFVCPHCDTATTIFGEGGARRWAAREGVRLLGEIPLETTIRRGGDEGRPAVLGGGAPRTAAALQAFAEAVAFAVADRNARTPEPDQPSLRFSV